MNPFAAAAMVYQREWCARPLRLDLEAHLLHGYVYSSPEAFIMARYVCRDWPESVILDPFQNPEGDRDCLMVWLASGDTSKMFTFSHIPVKWVAFQKRNELRFHPYEPLKRRCNAL